MKGASLEVARRVKGLRRQRDWSQEELAKRAKLHKNTVFHVESGRGDCLLSTVYRMAEAFEVDVRDLLMPLRRDTATWVAYVEKHALQALAAVEALKPMALSPEASALVEELESRLRRGLDGLQQVKLRLGTEKGSGKQPRS